MAEPIEQEKAQNEIKYVKINDSIPNLRLQSSMLSGKKSSLRNKKKSTIVSRVVLTCFILMMICSAILYSLLVAIVKWASNLGYGSMEIMVIRAIIQVLVAVPLSVISFDTVTKRCKCVYNDLKKDISEKMTRRLWIYCVLRGFFGALTGICYFEAITNLPIGDAVVLYSMYPITTSFVAVIFLKESISYKYVLSLIGCVVGTFLILHPSFIDSLFGKTSGPHNEHTVLWGYIPAILSAFLMSGVFIFIRLAKKAPSSILIVFQGIECIIFGVIIGLSVQHFKWLYHFEDWICFIALGVVGYGAQWTLTLASQHLQAALSSILRSTDIVWTYIWQIVFFGTIPSWLTVVGAVIIFISILNVSIEKIRQKAKMAKELAQQKKSLTIVQRSSVKGSIND